MLRIAVTGGIACGKSLVGAYIAERGVPVCDADDLARVALKAGTEEFAEVVREFGREMVGADGEIDRRRLGALVFEDPGARERLNRLVHPAVRDAWRAWIAAREREGHSLAAVIIPLLFEIGGEAEWDAVISVIAAPDVQRRRLGERGLAPDEVEARIAAQLPMEVKAWKADHVIVNSGARELTREQVDRVLSRMRGRGT
jgi:dephospho-CoA kinase